MFMTCVIHAHSYLQENGEVTESQSHTRSPSPDPRSRRPNKKRKTRHPTRVKFPDGKPNILKRHGFLANSVEVVSKGIISAAEATDLFKM